LAMKIRADRVDQRALLRQFGGAGCAGFGVSANCGREFGAAYSGFDQRGFVFLT